MSKLEQISLMVDGEMSESDIRAMLTGLDAEDQKVWNRYHLIGDALRSESLIEHHQPDLVDRIAVLIQDEPTIVAPVLAKTLSDQRRMSAVFSAARSLKVVATVASVVVIAFSLNRVVPPQVSDIQMVKSGLSIPKVSDQELALWQEYFMAHQQNAVRSGLAGVTPIARADSDAPVLNGASESVMVSRSAAKEWMNVWEPEKVSGMDSVRFQYVATER